ncbi:MAG: phosphate/phosphite/phosphonate ABC transporter substrate-binding protein [Ectothiorhodospiraceae bacterium]|nr:phosphate/phosphite/phosphonate ABC transporter substrate-binding protein [Ectothiorhodospiraceae bacterium]
MSIDFILRKSSIRLISALIFVTSSSTAWAVDNTSHSHNHNDTYHYGAFPAFPAKKLEAIHSRIAAAFSKILGHPVQFRSRSNIKSFQTQMREEVYDILWTQPFDYVQVAADHGYIPIARFMGPFDKQGKGLIRARIAVSPDSNIFNVRQLAGKTIANSGVGAAVTLLGQSYIESLDINTKSEISMVYLRNHFACIQYVIIGRASACITAAPPLEMFKKQHNINLRVIGVSQPIPSPLMVVHQRIPLHQRLLLQKEMLSWKNNKRGQKILQLHQLRGFIKTIDSDYQPVRDIVRQLQLQP